MKLKYKIITLLAAVGLPMYLLFASTLAEAKGKYDMTYGLSIYPFEVKEKTLLMKKNKNQVFVIPDDIGVEISCTFSDHNNNVLVEYSNVEKCGFATTTEENKTIYVQIKHSLTSTVGVELKHKAR